MKCVEKTKVYDTVKVIATLLVVIAHVTRMYTPTGVYHPVNESLTLNYLTEYIYKFHMPLFVCVSGCIYGYCINLGKYKNNRVFIINKAKRLLIPYFFCGLLYVAPVMQILKIDTQGYLRYCVSGIILSYNSRHLWYIFALFFIFVLAMVTKPLIKTSKGMIAVIVLSILIKHYVYKIPVEFQLQAAGNYQIYFFVGVALNHIYDKISNLMVKYRYLSILFSFILTMMFVWNPNQITNLMYIYMGILMIIMFAQWIVVSREAILDSYTYKCLKKNSFGIYLFHPMIIYVLFYLGESVNVNPILLSMVVFAISILVSILITNIFRKLGLGILIGESVVHVKNNIQLKKVL